MFYAHFVLSKKGPLARIWLAAHWDKKLTRAHVFETNISSSVEAILEPKLKMALRTSGHLLLGVVRIYSRKAKYLLADCNEAFVKIKMAFRPGVVDLPDETNREAAIAAITLPENIHDFEATIADLNEINMNTIAINQSRPEDITMREDFGEINLGRQDDDFGDSAFDELSSREIIRDGDKTFGDGIYRANDQLSVHHGGDFSHDMDATLIDVKHRLRDSDKQIKSIDSVGGPENIGIDDDFEDNFLEPDDDDENFGGGLVHSLFTDGIFEDPVAQKQLEHLTSEIESQMANSHFDLGQGATPTPASIDDGMHVHDNLTGDKGLDVFVSSADRAVINASAANIMTDTKLGIGMTTLGSEGTTLLANESEAFALPPIDTTSVTGIEPRRANKRKRRLIVDEQKSIPSEIMKSQMENTSDITTQLDLAPPSKKLMYWKETGYVDKLFTLPARTNTSRVLQRLFVRNLYTQTVLDDATVESWYTAAMGPNQNYSTHVDQSLRTNSFEVNTSNTYSPALSHTQKDMAGFVHEKLGAIAEVSEDKNDRINSGSKPFTSPTSSHGMIGDDLDNDHHDDLGFMMQPDTPYLPSPSILSEAPRSVIQVDMLTLERELAAADEEVEHEMIHKSHISQLPLNLASKEAMESLAGLATDESLEERRLEKRSKILLRVLYSHQQQHGWDDPLSLHNLCHGNTKKQAASKFYTVLLLRKQGAVNLNQEMAYSDILISRGPSFNRLIEP